MGLHEHWKNKRIATARDRGEKIIRIKRAGTRIQVTTPYNPLFPSRAAEFGGRWRPRTSIWTFPGKSERLLLATLTELFPDYLVME